MRWNDSKHELEEFWVEEIAGCACLEHLRLLQKEYELSHPVGCEFIPRLHDQVQHAIKIAILVERWRKSDPETLVAHFEEEILKDIDV
ncbi:MAG: hypothetical protein WC477_04870 [Patescibacteria group bacterium]